MFSAFWGLCPVCNVPHDEGGFVTIKGEDKKVYICLSCLDKMEEKLKPSSIANYSYTLDEIKERID